MDCCTEFVLGFVLFLVVVVVILVMNHFRAAADAKENLSQSNHYIYKRYEQPDVLGGTNLDRFFIECVLSECVDFKKEKNIARAKMLAEKYNLSYENGIEKLYLQARDAHRAISGTIIADQLAKQKDAEQEEFNLLNRYSELDGKAKRIAMLVDQRNKLLETAKNLEQGMASLVNLTQQQERNWGVWGGISEGIAGVGAGVSTALEVQAENARIRAKNKENLRAAAPAYFAVSNRASENRSNAEKIQIEINAMSEKLISEMPANKVMKQLDVFNVIVDVSETGAFKITASIKAKNKLFIYDDVRAMADGTLLAHLYEDDQEIGTAKMVLPVNGVSLTEVGIVGMGLDGAQIGKEYTVKFTPYKLWLIEK